MIKTIAFNNEATQIIEEYVRANNCNYNKAVNNLILSHKETELLKLVKNINRGVISIYKEIPKTNNLP